MLVGGVVKLVKVVVDGRVVRFVSIGVLGYRENIEAVVAMGSSRIQGCCKW